MSEVGQALVREPEAETPEQYSARVHQLTLAYPALFVGAIAGIALLVRHAQHYVALAQRSNVETLLLAFLFVFFVYIAALSAQGALGALRIAGYAVQARFGDPDEVDRRMTRALSRKSSLPSSGAMNLIVEREGRPGLAVRLQVADGAGAIGSVQFAGSEIAFEHEGNLGSNSVLAYVVHQINHIARPRGLDTRLEIIFWHAIDDEATLEHLSLVRFAQNLERQLGADELWPKIVLSDDHCRHLEERLSPICRAIRREGFLPDWEFQAEHKVPLIPEPLGLISLVRSERRSDPIASMGCAVVIVLAVVGILLFFVLVPPWVPGV
jgi:hypothetical protein